MVKKTFLVLICFIGSIIFVSTLHGQGSKKTVTLPSGDVIWDLNGEWDVIIEHYGKWARYGTYPNVFKTTQKGSSFTGIRMKDNPPPSTCRAGSNCVQGELDKNGFKRIEIIVSGADIILSKGQISEDGNKISIDTPQLLRETWTRR